jgi:hypothetical protein
MVMAFVHLKTTWCESSDSCPQIVQQSSVSSVPLHLFFFVGNESVAIRHVKTLVFGCTYTFHIRFQIDCSPFGAELELQAVGCCFCTKASR